MTAINETLLPALLLVVYFFIVIQLLPQPEAVIKQQVNSVVAIEIELPATTLEEAVDCSQLSIAILQEKGTVSANSHAVISRDWLETQFLANLKAIASELCIYS